MTDREWMHKAEEVMANTYKRFPILIERGRGCTLWDAAGRTYTDFVAGIAVCNLGHAHPKVAQTLSRQAETLLHVSNLYYTRPQTALAAWLVEHSFADKVFFCNSGAEANEAAIKLARKYFQDRDAPDRCRIIAMEQSFHGRTMAALSATGQEKIRAGYHPLLPGFDFVPFDDLDALAAKMGPHTAGVLLEPVQGEGGVRVPAADYLRGVADLCRKNGSLLMLDEIQTGLGRTGALFAHQHTDVVPDIMTLAKALGNGLPIGAMLAGKKVAAAFGAGAHASTFGGTPLVTAAALTVVETMEADNVVANARRMGAYFKQALLRLQRRHPVIKDVRGLGLLLGMRIAADGDAVVKCMMDKGFLINCIQGSILRFVPPLIVTSEEIDALTAALDETLAEVS